MKVFVKEGCVTLCVALPFTLKSILRQKKNYGKTQLLHHAKILSSTNPLEKTKILQDIITL
jgi:hypothetical protein